MREAPRRVSALQARVPAPRPSTLEPARHHDLLLGVKGDGVLSVGVEVAEEGLLPSGEWEECHWRRNADVDPHHADLDAARKLARPLSIRREDGRGLALLSFIHQLARAIERIDA